MIDEPEIGLHPKALQELFEILRTYDPNKKIIIATHSSYLLNLVDINNVHLAEFDDNGKVNFVEVSEIKNLAKRLRSKYVNFGNLLADNFKDKDDLDLDE